MTQTEQIQRILPARMGGFFLLLFLVGCNSSGDSSPSGGDGDTDTDSDSDTDTDTDSDSDTDPDGDTDVYSERDSDLTVVQEDAGPPIDVDAGAPDGEGGLSIVILPDTQSYVAWSESVMVDQTDWIVENKDTYNIRLVAHVGDIVHNYGTVASEWIFVQSCLESLDAVDLPYALTPGNRDYIEDTRNSDSFNNTFPPDTFTGMPSFGGSFEQSKSDNSYHYIVSDSIKLVVLMLEFGPRDEVLDWAGEVVTNHPDHVFIIVTHAYLNNDDELLGPHSQHSPTNGYGLGSDANDGVDMWEKLVSRHSNIRFVLSGHVGNSTDGAGRLVSRGAGGSQVFQMMANYQYFPWNNTGYLLLMAFEPEHKTITISTYSPTLDTFLTTPDTYIVLTDVSFFR